jgi:hypothetical protein
VPVDTVWRPAPSSTGTSHGLLYEQPALCNTIIVNFLTTEPVPTIAPVRRASLA